jgi:type II secretory pathway pseudopilin PulG
MKPRISNHKTTALTLVEVLVVIVVLVILAAVIFSALNHHSGGAQKIACVNNLKEVGLAYRIWAGDNSDKYPMAISVTNGGTLELTSGRDAWKTYLVMSNVLSTPKILFCPQDMEHRRAATNFSDDLKTHISYFIGLDATDNQNVLLSGDDNFLIAGSPVSPGLIEVTSNTPIAWDSSRHVDVKTRLWLFSTKTKFGYIGMGDGSALQLNNAALLNQVRQTNLATNRLMIP